MKAKIPAFMIACVGLVSLTLLLPAGCRKQATIAGSEFEGADEVAQSAQIDVLADGSEKGGAQAWSENCMRCHNLRPPAERSDREWDIIVHHMRVRANLTAEEHRLILAFLQAAN